MKATSNHCKEATGHLSADLEIIPLCGERDTAKLIYRVVVDTTL